MIWIVTACTLSAVLLVKLGALIVWVSILVLAIKSIVAIAAVVSLATFAWISWRRKRPS